MNNGAEDVMLLERCNCVFHLSCVREYVEEALKVMKVEYPCPNADC